MSKKSYIKRIEKLRSKDSIFKILKILYKVLPLVMIVTYPIMIIIKALEGFSLKLCFLIFVPACTLILVTLLRKYINRERPYIKFDTQPLIAKKATGESFPSRHTASAFIIAMSGFLFSPIIGILLLLIAIIIGLTRILAGVHFVTDVLAGMGISILIGFVFFILI